MEMNLVMPNNYVELEQEEMMYVDGGMSWWDKSLIIGAAVAVGAALTVAISTGQVWLCAKICGLTFKTMVSKFGVGAVAGIVSSSLGVSFGIVYKALDILKSW